MKKTVLLIAITLFATQAFAQQSPPPGYCEVKVCNKLERFTLSPWSMIKDKVGETCSISLLPKKDSVEGKILDSSTRWYQGSSINPTKKSVTRVKEVKRCN